MLRVLLAISMVAGCVRAASTVDGRVVNSINGVGVPRASIRLRADGEIRYTTVTDAEGRFHLDAVAPGVYRTLCSAAEYSPSPHGGEAGVTVQVPGGDQPVRVEIKLDPMAKISGRVLDPDGEPVPNADVWLMSSGRLPLLRKVNTDSRGEYRFTVPEFPLTWRVAASAPASLRTPEPGVAWSLTYFPEDIAVRSGAERWSVDIRLKTAPARRIRGVVLDATGRPAAGAEIFLARPIGPGSVIQTKSSTDGSFELSAVVDDEWRLTSQMKIGDVTQWAARPLSVKGRDLDEIELHLNTPFSITVKVTLDVPEGMPAPSPPEADVVLEANDGLPGDLSRPGLPSGRTAVDASIYRNLYPGSYMINVFSPPTPGAFLDTIRIGDRDALAENVPILSGAEPITVAYKFGGGTVRGTVDNCGNGHVVLIPADPIRRRPSFLVPTKCGENGRFELRSVRPGDYYGLAVSTSDVPRVNAIMADDAALAAATRITVRNNETTLADLRLIHP